MEAASPNAEVEAVHFPEPKPCGSYLCDQDHDGPCWVCGERWPCAAYQAATRIAINKFPINGAA